MKGEALLRFAEARPHTVYDLFDGDGQRIYVGCTVDLAARMVHHVRQEYGSRIAYAVPVLVAARAEARALEAMRIRRLRPPLNKAHNPDALEQRTAAQRAGRAHYRALRAAHSTA